MKKFFLSFFTGSRGSSPSLLKNELMTKRHDYIMSLRKVEGVSDEKGHIHESVTSDPHPNPKDYVFPFENLVLEGGGSKGLAYCGGIQYLEDIGVMPQIKRFAGTSAGAIMAALLAVGYRSDEISEFMKQNLEDTFKDGNFFWAITNVFGSFGFHPGNRFGDWLGEKLEKKTGTADITFDEIRRKYKKELCVVVTNLNWMRPEYCHPKTTPDMPVKTAVRMSMSIPGLFTAKMYPLFGGNDIFVDGGLTCNYPIHCFDGWFLSMSKKDNFIDRLLVTDDRRDIYARKFEQVNDKSLGFVVYADSDEDVLRGGLEHGRPMPEKPKTDTKLSKERADEERADLKKSESVYRQLKEAVASFQRTLEKNDLGEGTIDRKELETALNDDSFTETHRKMLFGEETDVFNYLDHNKDGKIDHDELINFIGELGIPLHNWSVRYRRRDVSTIMCFLRRLLDTLLINSEKINIKHTDVDRTVGINTGYVGTTDFELEDADREFVLKRGRNACQMYFQHFIETKNPPQK